MTAIRANRYFYNRRKYCHRPNSKGAEIVSSFVLSPFGIFVTRDFVLDSVGFRVPRDVRRRLTVDRGGEKRFYLQWSETGDFSSLAKREFLVCKTSRGRDLEFSGRVSTVGFLF